MREHSRHLHAEPEQIHREAQGDPWWASIGDHMGFWSELEVKKEAEQVAVVWDDQAKLIHFCVQQGGMKVCKAMSAEEYFLLSPAEEMKLAGDQARFLRSLQE